MNRTWGNRREGGRKSLTPLLVKFILNAIRFHGCWPGEKCAPQISALVVMQCEAKGFRNLPAMLFVAVG